MINLEKIQREPLHDQEMLSVILSRDTDNYNLEVSIKGSYYFISGDKNHLIGVLRELGVSEIEGFPMDSVLEVIKVNGREYKFFISIYKISKVRKYISTSLGESKKN